MLIYCPQRTTENYTEAMPHKDDEKKRLLLMSRGLMYDIQKKKKKHMNALPDAMKMESNADYTSHLHSEYHLKHTSTGRYGRPNERCGVQALYSEGRGF
jgi:hypothetical protein